MRIFFLLCYLTLPNLVYDSEKNSRTSFSERTYSRVGAEAICVDGVKGSSAGLY